MSENFRGSKVFRFLVDSSEPTIFSWALILKNINNNKKNKLKNKFDSVEVNEKYFIS